MDQSIHRSRPLRHPGGVATGRHRSHTNADRDLGPRVGQRPDHDLAGRNPGSCHRPPRSPNRGRIPGPHEQPGRDRPVRLGSLLCGPGSVAASRNHRLTATVGPGKAGQRCASLAKATPGPGLLAGFAAGRGICSLKVFGRSSLGRVIVRLAVYLPLACLTAFLFNAYLSSELAYYAILFWPLLLLWVLAGVVVAVANVEWRVRRAYLLANAGAIATTPVIW